MEVGEEGEYIYQGGGGEGGMEVGEEGEYICLSLHCHHQNYSCVKVDSDESHFNVSVGSDGQSHKNSVHKPQLLKREESQSRFEPRSFRLPSSPFLKCCFR